MRLLLQIISACALCVVSNTCFAQAIATQFVYPGGDMYTPPTEQGNGNPYKITQNFNTESTYVDGLAKGAWCGDKITLSPLPYTDQTTCVSKNGKWMYGHSGADLSKGSCGGTISATANGIVEFSGVYSGYGNLLKIRHVLPNGRVIHSLYGHRQSVYMSAGQSVVMGQLVGNVGSTGAGTFCHLHFAIYADEMEPYITTVNKIPVGYIFDDNGFITTGGYQVYPNTMRYFFDPLLFVNDRNNKYTAPLACCTVIAPITMSFGVVTRTAYITDSSGTTLSLQRAVDTGWLDPYVYEKHADGLWYYYPAKTKIEEYVLNQGTTYGLIAKQTGLTLVYFRPGNTYIDARSRQDMVTYVQTVSGFGKAYRETYGANLNWRPPYAISWMGFIWNGSQWTSVNQAYDVNNPLNRYASYYNLSTSQWTAWVQVY
jgi:murein DD-endopeptidase MepM/ murein hydrolase activator NlpD